MVGEVGCAIDINLGIILHKNQQTIHDCDKRFRVIKAGKRFGKSKWATYAIVKMAFEKNRGLFWFVCPTFSQAKDIAWSTLEWLIPPQLIKNKQQNELKITLINDSVIQLKSADNPDSLRGPALDGVVLDEAAYIDPYLWFAIIRGQLSGSKGPAYFISSPNRKGKNWFTDFHEQAKRRQAAGEDWSAFYFTIYDNPTLDRQEIEDIKSDCSDDVWSLEYMAIESEFAGQMYHEFHPVENVQNKDYDAALPLVEGGDWGIAHPTAWLWLQYDLATKCVWVIEEFSKSGFVIEESCTWIKRIRGEKPVEWSVIDPSANRRDMTSGRTLRDEFSRNGVVCFPGDNRDRGYDIVRMFLKKRLLKIHPKCKNLLYEIKNLQYGDKDGDDMCDALRYALVRIHDLTFGGSLPGKADEQVENKAEISFNDPLLFPKKNKAGQSWIEQQIEFVNAA